MKIFQNISIKYLLQYTRKNFSKANDLNIKTSKTNLNEKREMLRKNSMKIINDAPITKNNEIPQQRNIEEDKKLNKKFKSESPINRGTTNYIIPKKEDAIKNIRFKGIYEKDSEDKNSPKVDYLYGINSIKCAIYTQKSRIRALYIQKDYNIDDANIQGIINTARSSNIPINNFSKDQLDLFTGFREHNGILLKTEQKDYKHIKKNEEFFDSLEKKKGNIFVLLDKVIDPQNFGSIIRSCAFYGVDKVIVNKKSRPSLSPAVINVSAGASEIIDIYDLKHFKSFVQEASERKWKVLSTSAKFENVTLKKNKTKANSININDLKLNKDSNVLITFGSESKGLEEDILSLTDYNVFIPPCLDFHMIGKSPFNLVESLNVGVSVGIILDVVKRKLISHNKY